MEHQADVAGQGHFPRMPEQAEAGDVRGGMYFEAQGNLAGDTVERAHGGDGGLS